LNLNREAWNRDEVGVWYGAWSHQDWEEASRHAKPFEYLKALPVQRELNWPGGLSKAAFDTARRFMTDVTEGDWVLVFFGESLHLARVRSSALSEPDHPFNGDGETFKFRRIGEKKCFGLARLPDAYRLLASAGRGNVHQFGNKALVNLLIRSRSEEDVNSKVAALSPREWLDLLGPTGWESFCLGYLMSKEEFVPTGLLPGRTLRALDLIGRSRKDDVKILAQCKKDPYPVPITESFREATEGFRDRARCYFFAYGGCTDAPDRITVWTRAEAEEWIQREDGRRYYDLFRA
jgi:hypothetical protein